MVYRRHYALLFHHCVPLRHHSAALYHYSVWFLPNDQVQSLCRTVHCVTESYCALTVSYLTLELP